VRIRATRGRARGCWPHFIELNNRVLANFSAEERQKIGIHTCPAATRDSVPFADVPYNNLLPEMFKINAGYFLIQLASDATRTRSTNRSDNTAATTRCATSASR